MSPISSCQPRALQCVGEQGCRGAAPWPGHRLAGTQPPREGSCQVRSRARILLTTEIFLPAAASPAPRQPWAGPTWAQPRCHAHCGLLHLWCPAGAGCQHQAAGDRAMFALLSPHRARHEHRLAPLGQGWEVPQWGQALSRRVAGVHWLSLSPPFVTTGPQGDVLSPDQALNSAGHSHGTIAHCIFSPCWGTPVRLSRVRAAQPTAQPCSARRAPPVPSPMPGTCPRCRKGSRSIRPFAAAVMCHLVPGGMQAMPSSGVTSLGCLLQLLRCLNHSGLTGSTGVSWAPGFTGLLPGWHHDPAPAPGAKREQGSSPHAWPSLEAQTQRYLSRMRKSSTMRTMGRKMRSRLSISAASSSASTRR